jgi:hypothetical protein
MSYVYLDDTVRACFGTADATGEAADADSTPVAVVLEQGTPLAYSPTVTNEATGLYEAAIACTTANGFEVGKEYSVYITAVVGGVTGRDGLVHFEVTNEIWDEVIEGAYTARELMRGYNSALLAKANGFNTATRNFRDLADTKNRIVAATDASGRTAITLDLT